MQMKNKMIISLKKIRDRHLPLVGSKAFGLARLRQIGLKIPNGFCLTGTNFREHIESSEVSHKIQLAVEKLDSNSQEGRTNTLLGIRQAIINAHLAVDLRNEIENHYHALVAERVAVRSSATAEDLPGHSFSGQYETYLGIDNVDSCIDAIKKCWASLWIDRAYYYRQRNGFDHLAVNMAVIVQSLVEADISGILFTADPVMGYKGRMIVEAVPGLGDPLVSGKATPQRFKITRKQGRIVTKTQMPETGITDSMIKRLIKVGKKVERSFGQPQDIEWAIKDNKLFLLQSRPITVTPQRKSWEERQVWSNANTGEVLPDVQTPLSCSITQRLFNRAIDQACTLLCIQLNNHPLYGLVGGRVYFNINTAVGMLKCVPILRQLDFGAVFGGEQRNLADIGQLDIPEEDTPELVFSLYKMLLRIPGLLYQLLTYKSKKGEAMMHELKQRGIRLQGLDVTGMSTATLIQTFVAEIDDLEAFIADKRALSGLLNGIIGAASLQILQKVCIRWFGADGNTISNRLLVGLGNMDDAEAGLDLWKLAQTAHEMADVEQTILLNNDWKATREQISGLSQGSLFLEKWNKFMSRHGHHCRGEMEVFNARWAETPDYILSIVRNYICGLDQANPLENYKQYAQNRETLAASCRKRLKNPLKRVAFNYLLTHARRFPLGRENCKSDFARAIAVWRNMLVELGRRLHKCGILSDVEDVFFLRLEEIEPVTRRKADFDIKHTIVMRRTEYEKNKSVMPPKVVVGNFNPNDYASESVNTKAEVLMGLAITAGVVTGKARVILKADTDEQVLPGEVLVAPFTDPGWTPYFMPAAAIVMDIGGILSHGSIIAREYGIPAVVNVGPATKIITTGQTIQVDADHGTVKILK